MWSESTEATLPLRTGLTTGCCATACCVAGAYLLLADEQKIIVRVTLPRGKVVELTMDSIICDREKVCATTIKDAGDDPDVTHGAKVFVELSLRPESGVQFSAAKGVGMVTRIGLLLDVGEPAINPVPRQMMEQHLSDIAGKLRYSGGFNVRVGIEDGQQLALKTMNPRLGILGGLSILGTTGIVRPFSCSAYIASINQGIDVAAANGYEHIAATTGNTSEAFIKQYYRLPEIALIEMGDFVGAVFKHLKKVSMKKLSLCGGFGKISKIGNGKLDLHSNKSSIDFDNFASLAEQAGATAEVIKKIQIANTSLEVLGFCREVNIDMGALICQQALNIAQQQLPTAIEVEVLAVDRLGQMVGQALSSVASV